MGPSRVTVAVLACACLAACGDNVASSVADADPSPSQDACEPPNSNRGLSLLLAADTRGEPTPVEAAHAFARRGGLWTGPQDGWRVVSEDANGAKLVSGSSSVHVVRVKDDTWAVDQANHCSR